MRNLKSNVKRNCLKCNLYFERYMEPHKLRKGGGKYCSRSCSNAVGTKHTEKTKKRLSESKMGTKNPQYGLREEKSMHWKGDSVGYYGIHDWIERQRGKAQICENCNTDDAKRYEWANISGEYRRDLSDWKQLCKKCHNDYDGVNAWQNWKRSKGYAL